MATCITKARSNYFSVTDVPAFLTMMQKWEKDFGIRIMKKRIDEDQTVYAFSYETTSVNINGALCDLQKILPEWEAVIIQEIAYEQSLNGMMRYVIGKAIIITYNTVDTLDLSMLDVIRVTTGCYGSNESVYFLNLVRLCAYTKKEIKKVILSTKSYTEKDLVDLPTIIDQWKNEYRSDRSLAWPTL